MRKYTFEVVYIDETGQEISTEIEAVSKRSLKGILEKRSIKPIHVRHITPLKNTALSAAVFLVVISLSMLFCILQLLAYYGASLRDHSFNRSWSDSAPTVAIITESLSGAFGYSIILFASFFFSCIAIFFARNTSSINFAKKWATFVLVWWAINFIYYTSQFINA